MLPAVVWRQLAEQDLTDAYLHIHTDSPAAAERWLDAVAHAVEVLVANSGAGRLRETRSPRAAGLRSWVIGGFENYLVFYRSVSGCIEIVRILHGARDLPRVLTEDRRR